MSWEEKLHLWLKDSKKVLIMGVGNPLRRDDNLGNEIIELMKKLPPLKGVNFLRCETVPESFTGIIKRMKPDRIVIVDAAQIGAKPGEAILASPNEVKEIPISTHTLPITLLTEYVKKDTGAEIMLLAVQPREIADGDELSPEIKAAVKTISKKLLDILHRHFHKRKPSID